MQSPIGGLIGGVLAVFDATGHFVLALLIGKALARSNRAEMVRPIIGGVLTGAFLGVIVSLTIRMEIVGGVLVGATVGSYLLGQPSQRLLGPLPQSDPKSSTQL